jgi:hypothetical protein
MLFRSLSLVAALLFASPSLAVSFTVLGWDAGETVGVSFNGSSRSFATALFRESVDGVSGIGTSFCTDLLQTISTGTYNFTAYDPAAAEAAGFAATAPSRQFLFAAEIANAWSPNIGALASTLGITQVQAITGVQVAIWEAVYGDSFSVLSMSAGAQRAFDYVDGLSYSGYGNTQLYYSSTRQDQLFTPPIPEPSAMFVFGAGALLVGQALRRRRQLA